MSTANRQHEDVRGAVVLMVAIAGPANVLRAMKEELSVLCTLTDSGMCTRC